MRVTFKLFATLQDYLPSEGRKTNALTLDLEEGTTIQQIIERFALPEKLVHLVFINGSFVLPAQRDSRILSERDTLAIWPPVAGG